MERTEGVSWRRARLTRQVVSIGLLVSVPCLPGCGPAVGAGAVALLGGAGVAMASCYDRVDIKVLDSVTDLPVCDAHVYASNGDSVDEAGSCFHVALTEGDWVLRAVHPDYVAAQVRVTVPEHKKCLGNYQTVELRLNPRYPRAVPQATPVPVETAPAPEQPTAPPRDPWPDAPTPNEEPTQL